MALDRFPIRSSEAFRIFRKARYLITEDFKADIEATAQHLSIALFLLKRITG